jgi:cytoskeletal protein RodZ
VFEIGSSLREARIRQGIDFPALEQGTKIRAKYLRALEDERFELLPAHTYVKGFLRGYADFLGLDGQLYVDEYNSRYVIGGEEETRPLPTRRVPSARHRRRERRETGAVLLALGAIAVVTALVIAAWKFGGPEDSSVPGLDGTAGQTQKTKTAEPAKGTARITIWANRGDTSLQVFRGSLSGKVLYTGTLEKGQTQRFTDSRVALRIGRPQNVRVAVNGERAQLKARWGTYLVTPNGLLRITAQA